MGGNEQRYSLRGQPEKKIPEVSARYRIDTSGRLVEEN
jgi:hypothetical protein